MTQVIIYSNGIGGVAVCTPTGELPIEEVQAKDTPEGSLIVNSSDLPEEYNMFFDAWEMVDGKVKVNFSKAKEIKKDQLRIERDPLLKEQDVAFQRALESNGDTTAIVAEKQRLRDITNLADVATTLEELKNITL